MHFTALIFTKLIITQHIFVAICCMAIYPNWTKNVENICKIQLHPYMKYGFHCTHAQQDYMQISHTEFHQNQIK